jgi:hypothetical protein
VSTKPLDIAKLKASLDAGTPPEKLVPDHQIPPECVVPLREGEIVNGELKWKGYRYRAESSVGWIVLLDVGK